MYSCGSLIPLLRKSAWSTWNTEQKKYQYFLQHLYMRSISGTTFSYSIFETDWQMPYNFLGIIISANRFSTHLLYGLLEQRYERRIPEIRRLLLQQHLPLGVLGRRAVEVALQVARETTIMIIGQELSQVNRGVEILRTSICAPGSLYRRLLWLWADCPGVSWCNPPGQPWSRDLCTRL